MYNNFFDGFWSYFLFTSQVDWQVLLIVQFTMLSPHLNSSYLNSMVDLQVQLHSQLIFRSKTWFLVIYLNFQ